MEPMCNAQGTQGWAPVHCQQLPGVFSISVAAIHTKPLCASAFFCPREVLSGFSCVRVSVLGSVCAAPL